MKIIGNIILIVICLTGLLGVQTERADLLSEGIFLTVPDRKVLLIFGE
jgi:hypothetical protein